MLDDEIILIEQKDNRTANGFNEPVETRRPVFAKREDPQRSEFYAAKQAGMKLSATFKINADHYGGETVVEHAGKRYRVERSYPVNRVFVRLICSEVL